MNLYFAGGIALVATAAIVGYGHVRYTAGEEAGTTAGTVAGQVAENALWQTKVDEQAREASATLANAIASNAALQTRYDALDLTLKETHANAEAVKARASASLLAQSRAPGGLRDPHAPACPASGGRGGTAGGAAARDPAVGEGLPAAAGGRLSDALAQLLLGLAYDADQVVTVANECSAAMKSQP